MADALNVNAPDGAHAEPDGEVVKNEKHLAQLIKERNEAKAEAKALKDAKEEAERKALEETQQFKTLYEKQQGELKRLSELDARVKAIDERTDAKISELSGKLPEVHKSEYDAFISALDREKRLDWLMAKTSVIPEPKPSPAAARAASGQAKDPHEMTQKERAEWAMRDPAGFAKAMGR
jgi:hypothetical protein